MSNHVTVQYALAVNKHAFSVSLPIGYLGQTGRYRNWEGLGSFNQIRHISARAKTGEKKKLHEPTQLVKAVLNHPFSISTSLLEVPY